MKVVSSFLMEVESSISLAVANKVTCSFHDEVVVAELFLWRPQPTSHSTVLHSLIFAFQCQARMHHDSFHFSRLANQERD